MPANTIITVRKGSFSAWVSANPVLASGELGFDTTNNILKIGNGTSDWNSLSNHRHSSADITNFNSSVSGLLPVKDIVASSGINIFSVSGIYTISSPEEVVEYLTAAQFPSSGNTSLLYIATDDSRVYRWTGFQYVEIGPTAFVPLSSGNFSTLQVNGTGVVASSGGNSGYLSKFTASNTIDDSIIYQSSGNIGINTTNPIMNLHVAGSGYISNALGINLSNIQNNFVLDVNGNVAFRNAAVYTNGSIIEYGNQRFQLNAGAGSSAHSWVSVGNGRFGVGTTNPQTLIHASGLATGVGSLFRLQNGSSSNNTYFETRIGTPGNFDNYIFFNRNGTNFFGATNTSQLYLPNHTQVASNRQIIAESNANAVLNLYNASAQTELGYVSGNALRFLRSYVEVARFDGSGNFGIGTSTPSGRLDVRGNIYASGSLGINNPAPSSVLDVIGESRMQGILYFNQNNTDANDSSRNRCKIERVSGQNLTLTGGSNTIQLAGDGGKILIRSSTVGTEIGGDGANTYVSFHPGSNVEKARITPAGSLGIGTSTPSGQLHVLGTGIISSRLGIGTNNPSVPLEVAGNAFIDGNLVFDSFTESVVTIGNSSSGVVLNIGSGTVQTCTLTNNCVFTMPATIAGKSFTMFLNTGSGNYTANFSGVLWSDSAPPTITTTSSKVDILSFISDGTYWYGSYSQNYG
jgi:hypothetical protein